MKRLITLLAAAATLLPAVALACGGLFCNNTQPVTQAAERILFVKDGSQIHMHVQISYEGPPQDFGWLLPTAPGVKTAIGSQALFQQLDANYAPRFSMRQEFGANCNQDFNNRNAGAGGPTALPSAPQADGAEDDGVQVISREAVGPYDTVVLDAETVQDLRKWLNDNEFQIPDETDPKLKPYVEAGAVFVALKLLPGNDAGDVAPFHLTFPAEQPAVPIVPTAVAANPDMGIIVHVLGKDRAIPKNYAHVLINDGALDWFNQGANYADVVSQAADEAGGKAFTTDFAGDIAGFGQQFRPVSEAMLGNVKGASTLRELYEALEYQIDADLARLLGGLLDPPEGVSGAQFFSCPDCWGQVDWEAEVDGQAIAAEIEAEVNPAREHLADVFERFPYLTRMYSTMSPAEMDLDPVFTFNPDIDPVANQQTAVVHVECDIDGKVLEELTWLETPSGLRVPVPEGSVPNPIMRQDGATVRGENALGARVIEQIAERGQPMVVEDRTDAIQAQFGNSTGVAGGEGCGCDVNRSNGSWPALALVLLFGLVRRRRA